MVVRLLFITMLTGCVAETAPYVRETPIGPSPNTYPGVDGPPLLISVYNPLDVTVTATMRCYSIGKGWGPEWKWTIEPHGQKHELGRLMLEDLHGDACQVVRWSALP